MKYILTLLLLLNLELFSQSSTARFLYLHPSAEITSLGGAGVAILDNSFAAYYNPASFAYSKSFEISTSLEQPIPSFSNDAHSMIAISNPFNFGTIAISFNLFWMDPQIRTSSGSPQQIGLTYKIPELFSPTHSLIELSYATNINEDISMGISFGLLNINHSEIPTAYEIGTPNTSTVALDLGFIYKNLFTNMTYTEQTEFDNSWFDLSQHNGLSLGLSFLNFGPKVFFIDKLQEDDLPSVIQFGVSYWPLFTDLISSRILIDFENRIYDSDGLDNIHLGNEILIYKLIALRYGYNLNNIYSEGSFFTLGVGIKLKFISINIARYNKYVSPTWSFDLKANLEF